MKTEICASGTLKISAENGLESYALRKWSIDFSAEIEKQTGSGFSCESLVINTAFSLENE